MTEVNYGSFDNYTRIDDSPISTPVSPDYSIEGSHRKNMTSDTSIPDSSISLTTSTDPFSRSLSMYRNLRTTKISEMEAFIHFIKGNVGSGVLGIPFALSLSGLLIGPPLLLLISLLCLYCMMLLLRCCNHLSCTYHVQSLGYGDVAELAFKSYFVNQGSFGRVLVNTFLIITQFGFCSIYIILISKNIKTIVENYAPEFVIPLKVYMVLLLLPLMLTSFIWDMKTLAIFSMLGNVFIFIGLVAIVVHIFTHISYENLEELYIGDIKRLPIFFGMAIYAFESIGVILPLENQMERPEKFLMVITIGMFVVMSIQVFIGIFGFICFRYAISGSITFNLPVGIIGAISQVSIALCVYLTYPLMFYVPIEILSPSLKTYFVNCTSYSVEFWLRTTLVIVTFLFAVLIPHIELFIALIGALASCSLALVFPPLMYLMVFRTSVLQKLFCGCILFFGVTACITGSVYAVKDIVASFTVG